MEEFKRIRDIIKRLRDEGGCPWDREQTHESLKATCIEEACEVICGINVLSETGSGENLKEELGDLLLQVLMHAQIAEEEGLFNIDDVCSTLSEKMIRRHPHVFHIDTLDDNGNVLKTWDEIKEYEKRMGHREGEYLPEAFKESKEYINQAEKRKGYK